MSNRVCVLVVDDEPISADEMSELIEASFADRCDIAVYTAYNGPRALKIIQDKPVDILISDIQMPGMTGLQLAQKLREMNKDLQILFLTGFDDFNYAYEAFRQNATHYLLKTEGDDAILRAVGEVIDRLLANRRMTERIREAEARFTQMMPAYRRQKLLQLLLDMGSMETLQELSAMECDNLYIVMARTDQSGHPITLRQRLVVQNTVEQTVIEALNDSLLWVESLQVDMSLIWVFSMRESANYTDTFFQLVRKARRHLEELLHILLFFVVADRAVRTENLSREYQELHSMLSREILRDATGAAIRHVPRDSDALSRQIDALHQPLIQCVHDIKDGAFEQLQKHLEPITDYLNKSVHANDHFAEECTATLSGALLSYINANALYAVLESTDYRFRRGSSEWFTALAAELSSETQKNRAFAVKSITQYVTAYIRDHISEDIGTSALADVSGYSAGYLSRVFKQEMGMSIHEYITTTRMNLARELLSNTRLRVYEIASSCGYENTTYFIKVFKSQTGLTPQEFKQKAAAHHA